MSYLGRVARRATGIRGAAGLTPAGASGSPLARFDQRLNMPGVPPGVGGVGGVGAIAGAGREDEGGQGDPDTGVRFDAAAGAAASPPPAGAPEGGRAAPPIAPPSRARASTSGPAGGEPTSFSRRAADAASARSAPDARVDRRPGDATSSDPRLSRRQAEPDSGGAPTPRPPASGTAPAADPVAEALAKLQRWLATPPREHGSARRDAREADARQPGHEPASGVGPRLAGGPRQVRARAAAIERASAAAAPPRLRIGRIDVQVVTPPAAPAPVARAGRGAPSTAPAAPAGALPGYLTFGLRQT